MQNPKTPLFPTDYSSILKRIDEINPTQYAKTRNYLDGAITYLSPYISRGVISSKQVMDQILARGYAVEECEKLIQELGWREYFQRVWQVKKEKIWEDLKQDQQNVAHHEMLLNVAIGNTGIQVIDEQVKQLTDSGYIHNHVRMYLASMVCNIGKAHWEIPAKWMYYYLFDGDIASNNCSWQWVAGAFSSKKYYCNQENINKYSRSNQMGTFLDQSYEKLADMQIPAILKETSILQLHTNLPITDTPTLDFTKPTLIYNSYNLDPRWRANENTNRVLILEPSHFKSNPVSDKVLNFIIALSKNIPNLQVFTGEIDEIVALYALNKVSVKDQIISKTHPAFDYYPGVKDQPDWMFPNVSGYFPSFFNFWKRASSSIRRSFNQ